jgi:hypothetical protein
MALEGQRVLTDAQAAQKMLRMAARTLSQARRCLIQCNALVAEAPGGKAGIITEMVTADKDEVKAVYDKLVTMANAHKPTGAPDLSAPILLTD